MPRKCGFRGAADHEVTIRGDDDLATTVGAASRTVCSAASSGSGNARWPHLPEIAVTLDTVGPLTGVVLAGGRAERMGGHDKGLLPLAGEPLIAHAIRCLQPQVADVLISANRSLETYRQFGYRVVQDDESEQYRGPLAGILAAMRVTKTPYLLTAPCDSPFLPPDYAQRMREALERAHASLAVVFFEGFWQPAFALLPAELRDDLASYLAGGEGNAGRWLRRHQPTPVEFPDGPMLFRNINTPEELRQLESDWVVAGHRSLMRDANRG